MTPPHGNYVNLHKRQLQGSSRVLAALLRRGVHLGPMRLLTVRGRQTGLPRTNPVDVFESDGRYWIVSTHGVGDSNWVRNLRAAGEGTLSRGRQAAEFRATELSVAEAGEVLHRVLGPRLDRPIAGFVLRRTLNLGTHASPEAFREVVGLHPVFELALASRTR